MSNYQILAELLGPNIVPEQISAESGVIATHSFHKHERGKAMMPIYGLAGWEWKSRQSEEPEDIWQEFITVIKPAASTLREVLRNDSGAKLTVTLLGRLTQELLTSEEELRNHGYVISEGTKNDPLTRSELSLLDSLPLLEGSGIGVILKPVELQLLAELGATYVADIDVVLADEKSND